MQIYAKDLRFKRHRPQLDARTKSLPRHNSIRRTYKLISALLSPIRMIKVAIVGTNLLNLIANLKLILIVLGIAFDGLSARAAPATEQTVNLEAKRGWKSINSCSPIYVREGATFHLSASSAYNFTE